MNAPERRVSNLYTFHRDVLAVVELYELWAKPESVTKLTFSKRHFFVIHFATKHFGCYLFLMPLAERRRRIAIDGSLSNDGHIVTTISIDKGRIVIQESSLPTGVYHRVILRLRSKLESSTFLQFQADMVGKYDGTLYVISACWHHDLSTLHRSSLLDSFGKGSATIGLSVILCTKLTNQ